MTKEDRSTAPLAFNMATHGVSGVLLFSFLLYTISPEGTPTGGDIFKAGLVAIGVTGTQIMLSFAAIWYSRGLSDRARRNLLALIGAVFLGAAIFAGLGSASMIGRRIGETAYNQMIVESMIADVERSKDNESRIEALIPTFTSCSALSAGMLAREVAGGAISLQGRNAGPVSAELDAIRVACDHAGKALLSSRAVASDLFADMDRAVAKARRIVDNDGLDNHAKTTQLVRLSEELAKLGKELGKSVPVEALRPVADMLTKDRAAMGLSEEAVATIAAAVRPIAKAISSDLEETAEALKTPFQTARPVSNPMVYLALFPGQMIMPIGIAFLLEVTPLIMICIVLLGGRSTKADEDDNPDTPTNSGVDPKTPSSNPNKDQHNDNRVTSIDVARAAT